MTREIGFVALGLSMASIAACDPYPVAQPVAVAPSAAPSAREVHTFSVAKVTLADPFPDGVNGPPAGMTIVEASLVPAQGPPLRRHLPRLTVGKNDRFEDVLRRAEPVLATAKLDARSEIVFGTTNAAPPAEYDGVVVEKAPLATCANVTRASEGEANEDTIELADVVRAGTERVPLVDVHLDDAARRRMVAVPFAVVVDGRVELQMPADGAFDGHLRFAPHRAGSSQAKDAAGRIAAALAKHCE